MSDDDKKSNDQDIENVEHNEVVEVQEEAEVESDIIILYWESFSHISSYLQALFENANVSLKKLESLKDVYDYANKLPHIFIADVPLDSGLTGDLIDLNIYITCPKLYIFESQNELNYSFDELAKFNIFGLAKDDNLKERIAEHFARLELIDNIESYFQMDGLEIETNISINCNMHSINDKSIVIGKPGIYDVKEFTSAQIGLVNFNTLFDFSTESSKIVSENFYIECDTQEVIEKLKLFGFENHELIEVAYISDNPPRYHIFNKLGVKVIYYKSFDDYQGNERLIIVEDKKISSTKSSGTEAAQLKDKFILVFGRVFPIEKYLDNESKRVNVTTSLFDLNAIKDLIKDIKANSGDEDTYYFDVKNDLSRSIIKTKCTLTSINETNVTLELPFKLAQTTKLQVSFFGNSFLTVLHSEVSNKSFTTTCQLDSFSEMEINEIRRLVNKMSYLSTKDVDLSLFTTDREVLSYIFPKEVVAPLVKEEVTEEVERTVDESNTEDLS